jgi:hypothetical protein
MLAPVIEPCRAAWRGRRRAADPEAIARPSTDQEHCQAYDHDMGDQE